VRARVPGCARLSAEEDISRRAKGSASNFCCRCASETHRCRSNPRKKRGCPRCFQYGESYESDTRARTQHAEKGMLNGIDHNPSMSAPDGQVARLRICDSSKFVDARVEIRRARVFIRETGALIESVDKVGAIAREIRMIPRIERDTLVATASA
jgi:hypothetical protein